MRRALSYLVFIAVAVALGCALGPDDDPAEWPLLRLKGTHAEWWLRQQSQLVSRERLMASLEALSSIHSRYMHWDAGTAATLTWLQETLSAQGTVAEMDSFTFWRTRFIDTANVEVDFPGRVHPERIVLVGAHWDCLDYPESFQDSSVRAPGADDNASGVAALVELARLLQDVPCENSVRLVFFAAEEVGLWGSRRAANHWRDEEGPDSLLCLINVDMIGHDPDEPDAKLIFNDTSAGPAVTALEWASLAAGDVSIDTLRGDVSHWSNSDHHWFWHYDLPAMWLHEGPEDTLPEVNTDADSLVVIDPDYFTDCTRALLGAVLRLATPLSIGIQSP